MKQIEALAHGTYQKNARELDRRSTDSRDRQVVLTAANNGGALHDTKIT